MSQPTTNQRQNHLDRFTGDPSGLVIGRVAFSPCAQPGIQRATRQYLGLNAGLAPAAPEEEDGLWRYNMRHWAGPDLFTGYLHGVASYSLPVVTWYGECFDPQTVYNSGWTMYGKPLNREHRMRRHDPASRTPDAVLGCVMEVYPVGAEYRHQVSPLQVEDTDQAVRLSVTAALFKEASAVEQILGRHLSGRQEFALSIEVTYFIGDSGFVVVPSVPDRALNRLSGWTPEAYRRAGLYYVPVAEAPAELLATRGVERPEGDSQFRKATLSSQHMRDQRPDGGYYGQWEGHTVYWMMGGINGQVLYGGLAVVDVGAEPTARIERMEASRGGANHQRWLAALKSALPQKKD